MDFPKSSAVAALLNPIAWFPTMGTVGCAVPVSGLSSEGRWPIIGVPRLVAGMRVSASASASASAFAFAFVLVFAFALRGAGPAR